MPKAKPSQVIVHRIELQEKERDMLEQVVMANNVKNIIIPIATTAGIASASYIGYKSAKAAYGWGEDIVDGIRDNWYNRTAKEVLPENDQSVLDNLIDFGLFLVTGKGVLWDRK